MAMECEGGGEVGRGEGPSKGDKEKEMLQGKLLQVLMIPSDSSKSDLSL